MIPESAEHQSEDCAGKMSKQESSYKTIRERIIGGVYGPGYRLTIDSLAREFGMSQVPIRESIRRLEAEGWVIYPRNTGPLVSPIDYDKWVQAMETLALLEGYATAEAATQIGDREIDQLRALNSSMKDAIESLDVMTFSQLNRRFHFEIYNSCKNGYLIERLKETWLRLDAIRVTVFAYVPKRSKSAIGEHDEMIRAIERKADFAEIERMAREHKLRTMQAYIDRESQS